MRRNLPVCATLAALLLCGAIPARAQYVGANPRSGQTRVGYHAPFPGFMAAARPSAGMGAMGPCNGGFAFREYYFSFKFVAYAGFGPGSGFKRYGYAPGFAVSRPELGYPYGYHAFPEYTPAYASRTESDLGERAWALRAKAHTSSTAELARVEKLVASGDTELAARRFSTAVDRYQAASRISSELADPYVRQGFALAAQGRYAMAASAFRRALAIGIDRTNGLFSLEAISGALLLTEMNDRLEQALADSPVDPDLLLCLGMRFLYDDQPDRAQVYLAQAAELGVLSREDVERVLPEPAAAGQQATGKLITKVGF